MHLVRKAKMHSHLFVIVGDNDVNSISVEEIYKNYKKFEEAIWPTKVRFCGHLRRKDFDLKKVERNNLFLYQKLGKNIRARGLLKRKISGIGRDIIFIHMVKDIGTLVSSFSQL